jgi:tRNA-Thr(GGU) m(6)t(6)A37 methyltransferase TsaA
MNIQLKPIAFVKNSRKEPIDDNWSEILSGIRLEDHIPTEAFNHISDFSHLEVIFYFDRSDPAKIVFEGHPRANPAWPSVGIFAQRKKDRPNAIGLCTVELIKHQGRSLLVRNLDAIDGTPIIDIKPVFKEFQPKGVIKQPGWVSELMKDYWKWQS